MGMKVFGENTVIEVKNHGFKAICPQISAKISLANPVRAAPLEGFWAPFERVILVISV